MSTTSNKNYAKSDLDEFILFARIRAANRARMDQALLLFKPSFTPPFLCFLLQYLPLDCGLSLGRCCVFGQWLGVCAGASSYISAEQETYCLCS